MRVGGSDAAFTAMRRAGRLAATATLVALVAIVPAVSAGASTGSIPPAVAEFAKADDGLVVVLDEYFGVDQRGAGLDFSDGIQLGGIDRIFLWSEPFRSGQTTEAPVEYVNRWKVPLLIDDEPVGIAMIGIDPATVEPEMIDFLNDPIAAAALDDITTDATLIYEPETNAWFSLTDAVILPLVPGKAGITGKTALADYQTILSSRADVVVAPTPQPDRGSVQSVVLIAATSAAVVLALLIPTVVRSVRQRRERRGLRQES